LPVDRVLGAILPLDACEELYMIPKKDSDEDKDVMCEVWSKLTQCMQKVFDYQKKFLDNVEVGFF
jgi:hypothetical protein